MRRIRVLLLALLGLPASAAAQSKAIPVELAQAFLASANPFDTQGWVAITVDGPPRQWAIQELKGFRLRGSAASANSATVIYDVTGDPAEARQEAIRQFEAAGWKSPPPPQRPAQLDRGFLSSRVDWTVDRSPTLCRGERAAVINPMQFDSIRFLQVGYLGALSQGLCRPTQMPAGYRDPYADMPIPALLPPVRVDVRPTGSSGGGAAYGTTASARTTMPVAQLLEHYAAQLRTAGWEAAAANEGAGAGIQSWKKTHQNLSWFLMLTVVAPTDQIRLLQMQLHNLSSLTPQ